MLSRNRTSERGIAVIMTALFMVFLIPVVGLAIDASVLYVVRGRLSGACDAAALATGRSLNLDQTVDAQFPVARAYGAQFYQANFPNGMMATTPATGTPTITIQPINISTLQVQVTATVNAPTYFMRYFGYSTTPVAASGQTRRRDVNLVMVLDRSGSMAGTPCTNMKSAAIQFVRTFVPGRDKIGLVTFATNAGIMLPMTTNFNSANSIGGVSYQSAANTINAISCNNSTNSAYSYFKAYDMIMHYDSTQGTSSAAGRGQPSAMNLIVFFTDGEPNALTGQWPVKTQADTRPMTIGSSTFVSVPKTTCRDDSDRSSTHADWGKPYVGGIPSMVAKYGHMQTGGGLYRPEIASVSNTSEQRLSNSSVGRNGTEGCTFTLDTITNNELIQDIIGIPLQMTFPSVFDSSASMTFATEGNWTTRRWVNTTGWSGPTAYGNYLRLNDATENRNAGLNQMENLANLFRNNTPLGAANQELNVITYTIGLGSVIPMTLARQANDPSNPISGTSTAPTGLDHSKPYGKYVNASSASELGEAFATIASEILRISQ